MAISGGFESLSGINDPNQTTPSYQSAGGYSWQPNGSGGVDYFMLVDNGTSSKRVPITNTEYQRGTGENTNAIEQQASQDFGTSTNINGLLNTVGSGTTSTSGIGSGSGGGSSTAPKTFSHNGRVYDQGNSNDMQAYYGVRSGEIDKQLMDALKQGQFDQAKQIIDYKTQWDQQGKDLMSGYSQGMTNRQQNFQGLGARSYQSAMGESGRNALNQLGQAQDQRNTDLSSNNTGMDKAYNDFVKQNADTRTTAMDSLYNSQPGTDVNPTLKGYTPAAVSQTDISKFTPYTNFQQLASSPMAQQPVAGMTLSDKLKQMKDPNGWNINDFLLGKA